jgi:1,4-alpha-glucan branching enzyme
MERLDYFKDLGVNAIELMPVTEFDGNDSWGYSPNHFFALDKVYGAPDELKKFIDECHKRGIAVILDMVFNHATGLNPMNKLYPYGTDLSKNPWFNATAPHSDNVYEDWNHDFVPTKTMFTRSLAYWLTEYKVDGFRMDLSHGLCGTKANTSVANIKHYYENGVKAVSPDAYMILEHWGANMGSERPQLVNAGMMCWDNTTNAYYQTAMGWLKDGDNLSNANKDNYVTYCESHDEERAFFKAKQWGNGDLKTNEEARVARVPLNMAFLTMLNGPKMFYHFAELGFDYSKYQNAQGKWGKNDYGITSQLGTDYDCKMQAK